VGGQRIWHRSGRARVPHRSSGHTGTQQQEVLLRARRPALRLIKRRQSKNDRSPASSCPDLPIQSGRGFAGEPSANLQLTAIDLPGRVSLG
jgi:hypothetical protein